MSEKTEPALTPGEWEMIINRDPDGECSKAWSVWDIGHLGPVPVLQVDHEVLDFIPRHEIAAVCLHGQPFGFTWEDVELLRASANLWEQNAPHVADQLDDLAARVAALLPPR